MLKFNDYVNTIQFLFPEIKFEGNSSLARKNNFVFVSSFLLYYYCFSLLIFAYSALWDNVRNRRGFFEKYARIRKFDPLNPENWYLQSERKLMAVKVLVLFIFIFYLCKF